MKITFYKKEDINSHFSSGHFDYSSIQDLNPESFYIDIDNDFPPTCLRSQFRDEETTIASISTRLINDYGVEDEKQQIIILRLIEHANNAVLHHLNDYLDLNDEELCLQPLPANVTFTWDVTTQTITLQLPVAYLSPYSTISTATNDWDGDNSFNHSFNISHLSDFHIGVIKDSSYDWKPLGHAKLAISIANNHIEVNQYLIDLVPTPENLPRLLAFWQANNKKCLKCKIDSDEEILFEFAADLCQENAKRLLEDTDKYVLDPEDLKHTLRKYQEYKEALLNELESLTTPEKKLIEIERTNYEFKIANEIFSIKRNTESTASDKQKNKKRQAIKMAALKAKLNFYRKALAELSFESVITIFSKDIQPSKITTNTEIELRNTIANIINNNTQSVEVKSSINAINEEITTQTDAFNSYKQSVKTALKEIFVDSLLNTNTRTSILNSFEATLNQAKSEFHQIIFHENRDVMLPLEKELPSVFNIITYIKNKKDETLTTICEKYESALLKIANSEIFRHNIYVRKEKLVTLEQNFLKEIVRSKLLTSEDIETLLPLVNREKKTSQQFQTTIATINTAIDKKGLLTPYERDILWEEFNLTQLKIQLISENQHESNKLIDYHAKKFYKKVKEQSCITHAKLLDELTKEHTHFTNAEFLRYVISYAINQDAHFQNPSKSKTIELLLAPWRGIKTLIELPLLLGSLGLYKIDVYLAESANGHYLSVYNIPRLVIYPLHKLFDIGFFCARAIISPFTNHAEMKKKGLFWSALSITTSVAAWTAIIVATLGAASVPLSAFAGLVIPGILTEPIANELDIISHATKETDSFFPQENATARLVLVSEIALTVTTIGSTLTRIGKKIGAYFWPKRNEVPTALDDSFSAATQDLQSNNLSTYASLSSTIEQTPHTPPGSPRNGRNPSRDYPFHSPLSPIDNKRPHHNGSSFDSNDSMQHVVGLLRNHSFSSTTNNGNDFQTSFNARSGNSEIWERLVHTQPSCSRTSF